ncbi:putative phosphatase [Rubrobacter radiotolerans]|uniref:DUF839 domain-containing protein n=1 Tax=Rubrobacter radiotolerans TaxID=42256 RepID=A0A023X097_RUBRA|nr:alkaline phosphatase PhoX [Rubrobacter radiotolerans]AHY45469.1 putative phosphatase [Rubrobacter radiotolerans]MDX5892880.1 DUF839 domain-containing protein [Rubrobacter radiotolerans]SMC02670.1 hypothetical protein SAMN00767673_0188 [Rubrobacter radiotolerans DSM 5868]
MSIEQRRDAGGISRRKFLGLGGASAAFLAGSAVLGPLQTLGIRSALGAPMQRAEGYGPLVEAGDLLLPRGFSYRIISRAGEPMSDGNPTPTYFDGMAAYRGPRGTTVLIRNHENRRSTGRGGETDVVVPPEFRYDTDPRFNAGNTKLVVGANREVREDFAVLGGTSTNCAGGPMPWGSWIACEEVFQDGKEPHGYNFEIPAGAEGPVAPEPIKAAGRFVHEAVAWTGGVLYQTEDIRTNSCFYRYVPEGRISHAGQLARSRGTLQALRIVGEPNRNTDKGFPVGEPFPVDWVTVDDPDPPTDTVRFQAAAKGAALFDRQEGAWVGGGKVYFDCTSGGDADSGQVWEFDPRGQTLTLIYESPGPEELESPDNMVVVPRTGDILLCEDGDEPQHVRGVTQRGEIYDFARSVTNDSEFCGACFSPDGNTLFVNQQGGPAGPEGGVTYAIRGPFARRKSGPRHR